MPVRNCDICKYCTNVKFNYDKHMTSKRHLERCEDKRYFECQKCQKPYTTRSGLDIWYLSLLPCLILFLVRDLSTQRVFDKLRSHLLHNNTHMRIVEFVTLV